MRSRRLRSIFLPLIVALATLLGAAAPASASHLQGGFFTAKVTDTGRLQGTITYLEVTACPSGVGSQKSLPITITSPSAQVVSKSVATLATKCGAGGSTYEGSFDYPLDTTTFSSGAPDGDYTLEWTAGNRIAGIVNVTNSSAKSVRFRAKVRKVTGIATGAPFLGSEVATGVGIGQLYSQNLNASDPDDVLGNGTLTYVALTGDPDLAPDSNVIDLTKLQANGQIEIPVSTTSGFTNNSYYVYKVRVTDDQGDYAERDVLLKAVTPNRPPVINGLNTTTGYDIAAGATQTINFNATDPDAANTVKITGAALPSWVTLTQTSGNPATAQLTLNPPADANTRVYRFNFDATDNDSTQVLVGSKTIEVRVAGSPETQLKTWPAARTTSTTATFTFAAADPGYTFECSLDNFATFEVCSSPKTYTGLSDGPRTFKVRANDGTKVDPSPASYSWIVDTTAPTTTFATKPAAATSSTTANFTFTTNESGGVTYECSLDGAAFTSCTTPKSYTGLADGSHTLRVKATDVVGNVETTPAQYTWVIDRTAPDTTIGTKPSSPSNSDSATFTASSNESPVTFECKVDSGAWAACPDPITFTGLSDGSHTVQIRAVDAAGNTDATPASHTWTVDTTAPDTSLGTHPSSLSSSAAASFTFSSPDGTATFECKVDGGSWTTCTSPLSLTGLSDGSHTVDVRAVDPAGNKDATPESFTWTVDTTAPGTTLDSNPPAISDSASAAFTFSSADGTATFECKLDAGSWVACPSPKNLTGLADGSHTFQVRAVDPAGNTDATPESYTWIVDTTNPDTTLDTHPAALSNSTTGNFTFSSADSTATFECKVDGGSWTACTSPLSLTGLTDGSHTVEVRAVDPAGNKDATPESFTWTVDATAPGTALDSHPAALSDSASAAFTFSSPDGTATFECKLDAGSWVACPSPKSLTGLADGSHTFEVRAVDAAGNVDPSPKSYTWTVDTTHPNTTLDSHPAAQSASAAADFTFSSADGTATFECRLDGGSWGACTTPKHLTGLADGSHTFEVRAVDGAGNTDPSPQSYTWNVDTVTPSSSITTKPAAHSSSATATIAFTSSDGTATFECQLDGGAWAPCTSPKQYTGLADGDHTVKVRAVDPAGNVEGTPSSYTWNVDTAKPAAPTVKQAPNANATSATFVFDREPGATLECQIDGGAWVPCDTTYTPDLPDGKHTLKVRQTDAAGNVSDTAERTWNLDRKAPEAPTVLSGPTGTTTDRTVNFEFSAEPDSTIECRVDGGAWGPCTSPLRLADLGLGDHTLELRATDAAGNVSALSTERWTVAAKADPAPAKPEGPKTAKVEISRTVAVDATKSTVGCAVTGVTITGCTVGIYAKKSDLGLAEAGTKAGNQLVRIGTGKTQTDQETGRVGVKVTLNKTGKEAAARPGGVKVRVNIKARPASGGESLYAHRYSKIRPATQMVVPADGLFATDSSVISRVGKRYLQSVAGGLYGAKTVSCIGHTDAQGAATYNRRLGLARAKAVCHYLSRLGVHAPKKASSVGETRPRATNLTAAGRQLNRRVELSVRYQ